MSRNEVARALDDDGYVVVENVLDDSQLIDWLRAIEPIDWTTGNNTSGRMHGARNLLRIPKVRDLVVSRAIAGLVEQALGVRGIPVRGILFNKVAAANWSVAWHQDRMIAVRVRLEVPGYGPWSLKEDIWHVEPPAAILESMVTLRIHLDDCFDDNGPLQVISKSHRCGKLAPEEVDRLRQSAPIETCVVPRGGVVLMRPLILHASSKARQPSNRRVVHLEFAAAPFQNGLEWWTDAPMEETPVRVA